MKHFMRFIAILFSFVAIAPTGMHARLKRRIPIYRKINPITIPEAVPSIHEIVDTITAPIDARQFLFGASTSEHQCSPHCTPEVCSASKWAAEQGFAQPTDPEYEMDWWTNYKRYINDAVSQFGMQSIRFSIEMARVQPDGPDAWNQSALHHYADIYRYCLRKGVTPLVCFHHYTDPNWFIQKGGFEKIENVDYFVDQCVKVYEYIMDAVSHDPFALIGLKKMYPRVPLWITFNAAEAYAFRGYYANAGPPSIAKRSGLKTVANVIKNCCEATVRVSNALKESFASMNVPSVIQEPHIGFLKNIHQTDVAQDTAGQKLCSGLTRWMLGFADSIRNDAIYSFFTTGVFKAKLPVGSIVHKNPDAVGCLDFVGLNYYSNRYMSLARHVPVTDDSLTTDTDYYHYPQGVYRAIVELYERMIFPYEHCTGKKLMMYVAENGIATTDDTKRARFYHEYLYGIARAVQDGYPVYGYTPWALFDNYEWPSKDTNQERNFGMCSVVDGGRHLALKEGTAPLKEFGQLIV